MKPIELLYISLNPIQNAKPYRVMGAREDVSQTVAYLERPDSSLFTGKENINMSAFDNDTLSGYRYVFIPNRSWFRKKKGFFAYGSLAIWKYVRQSDIVVIYGHHFLTFWMAILAAKLHQKKLILTTDATYLEANDESHGFKLKLKPFILRFFYNNLAKAVFVPSTASKLFLQSLGVKEDRIVVTQYVVDEDLIGSISAATRIDLLRAQWKIPLIDTVFVFCAKFIDRKRPMDAIEAFGKIDNEHSSLILIGDGPLKQSLQQRVKELGLEQKIIFPGIVKYSQLPSFYTASDVLVFCSDHEPYGLPVNEAMLCGIPVIVSDRIGSRLDLVEEDKTGWTYPSGNVDALASIMDKCLKDLPSVKQMGKNAKEKMKSWSSDSNVKKQIDFFRFKGWLAQ